MTAIWQNDGSTWRVLEPARYENEEELHDRVEEAPQLLPLSGSPRLTVVGREVACGPGSADLVAVERDGRPVIIEVKLQRNPEARRAVVAQILSYASYLRGITVADFDGLLRSHLAKRGASRVVELVEREDQTGLLDSEAFETSLGQHLETGSFRLVLVLDSVPSDLVQLVGYLEAISGAQIVVDLISVSAYRVGATQLLVPQRLDPGTEAPAAAAQSTASTRQAVTVQGSEGFVDAIAEADAGVRPELERLARWATGLERDQMATLYTSHGQGRKTLVARVRGHDAGLATVWNDNGAYLTLYRTVFERLAPSTLLELERAGVVIGQGNSLKAPGDEVLELLRRAYSEAAARSGSGTAMGEGALEPGN